MPVIDAQVLKNVAFGALQAAKVPSSQAAQQVELLLEAELRGITSHGLMRLERLVRRIENGVIDPTARGRHEWQLPGVLAVDGCRGLGPVVANAALDAIMARATSTGIALAAVRNSNHLGMLGWYVERAVGEGFCALAFSTSEALVHPWGAKRAMLGTNPVAIGMPVGDRPFIIDTATSIVSMGEIHDRAQRQESIPAGWALDAEGNPTTDPSAAKNGAIAPFGQAKGYALGLAFELLVSGLAQAAIGRDVKGTLDDTEVCNKGDVFIVIRGPDVDFSDYLQSIRTMEPAAGFDRVHIPGERGRQTRDERLRNGVPIDDQVWTRLLALAGMEVAS